MTHPSARRSHTRLSDLEERELARRARNLENELRDTIALARRDSPAFQELEDQLEATQEDADLTATRALVERGLRLRDEASGPCRKARVLLGRIRRLRNRLVTSNLRLVSRIASRFRGRGLPLADLEQEGQLALIHATNLWDPDRGTRLGSYAGIWITRAISRAIDRRGRLVRPPLAWSVRARRLARVRARLEATSGESPDVETLAEEAKLEVSDVRALLRSDAASVVPLDRSDPDNVPLIETLASPDPSPAEQLHRADMNVETRRVLGELGERDREIITRRFALDDGERATNRELGDDLGVSGERVRQLQNRALRAMRAELGEASAWLA